MSVPSATRQPAPRSALRRLVARHPHVQISSKLPQYVAYWSYEQVQGRRAGQPRTFPQVVFLAPSEQRVRYLSGLIDGEREHRQLFRSDLIGRAVEALFDCGQRSR